MRLISKKLRRRCGRRGSSALRAQRAWTPARDHEAQKLEMAVNFCRQRYEILS